jgi:prevent-host-death family protein
MQRTVGMREAKAKLSHYVGLARRGEDVVLTDRGKPVARLVPVAARKASQEDLLRGLAELGLVDPAQASPPVHRPIRPSRNMSVSALVRQQRR